MAVTNINLKLRSVSWLNSKIESGKLMTNLLEYGVGQSSRAILSKALELKGGTGELEHGFFAFPVDSDDLMRCITVVDIFLIDINIMKGTNSYWDAIVNRWEILTTLCRHEEFSLVNKIMDEILADDENKGKLINEKGNS